MSGLALQIIPGEFAVSRLPPDASVPVWATGGNFVSLTRTADELSIVCASAQVPAEINTERGWRLLKFVGPFDFGAVGILASVTGPLAAAGISLLAIGTFDTDYVLIKEMRFAEATRLLAAMGHTLRD